MAGGCLPCRTPRRPWVRCISKMGAAAVALERYEEAVGYLTLSIEHGA